MNIGFKRNHNWGFARGLRGRGGSLKFGKVKLQHVLLTTTILDIYLLPLPSYCEGLNYHCLVSIDICWIDEININTTAYLCLYHSIYYDFFSHNNHEICNMHKSIAFTEVLAFLMTILTI